MSELWIALEDLPAEDRDLSFPEAGLWSETWDSLGLAGRVEEMGAEVHIAPRGDGGLVKGTLKGVVTLPCDRCAEDFQAEVEDTFSVFETLGGADDKDAEASAPETPDPETSDEDPRIREEDGVLQLNLGAILWEQLMLALPVKPVCRNDCKGLCDQCGVNRNLEDCDCARDEEDPRMAAFRDLKLS